MSDRDSSPYLFIAGAPRCGTTTLFDLLARQPGIAPCRVKEPGFLYPARFPMRRFRHLQFEDGLPAFARMFDRPGLRLEASANYLYAPGVAGRIRRHFPNARVLLVLRNPVDRLVSEFQFAKMMLLIPHDMSLGAYLDLQRMQDDRDRWREAHLRSLTNGRYSQFVSEYLEELGPGRVRVAWTDDLIAAPLETLRRICSFAGLDIGTLASPRVRKRNPSLQVRRPWLYSAWFHIDAWRTRRVARHGPEPFTRLLRRLGQPLFEWSTQEERPTPLAQADRAFLRDYYAAEPEHLRNLLGERPPWATAIASNA